MVIHEAHDASPSATVIRGFRRGTVGCPKHGSMYVWTAMTDSGPTFELELVKYDCGCIYSWQRDVIGARAEIEQWARC